MEMEEWKDVKKEMNSLTHEKKIYLGLLAQIVDARADQNMTQNELALISGLKQPAIARMENPNSQNAANLLTVIKYLDALGMELKVVPKKDSNK